MKSLVDEVGRILGEVVLIGSGERILLGVSGGLDSVVLLDLMLRLDPMIRLRIEVAHFNHGFRGRASDEDEEFVRELADAKGLSFHLGKLHPDDSKRPESLEMKARRCRHKFLADKASEIGAQHVALGHHADDQVETIFLRLFRGEGSSLGGIQFVAPSPANPRVRIIRPLLGLRRKELSDWAKEKALDFREDQTNHDETILRNRIRRKLVPIVVKEFGAGAFDGILRTAEISGAIADWAEAEARDWLSEHARGCFDSLPVPLQRSVVRAQVMDLKIDATFPRIVWLRKNAEGFLSLGLDVRIKRNLSGFVEVSKSPEPLAMNMSSLRFDLLDGPQSRDWAGVSIRLRRGSFKSGKERIPSRRAGGFERFDADAIGDLVTLRHWRAGDRFQPIGMKSPVKLQDLFVDAKIPAAHRRRLVVAEAEGRGIFWVEGLRIAEGFKLQSTSVRYLEWRWERGDAFLAAEHRTC